MREGHATRTCAAGASGNYGLALARAVVPGKLPRGRRRSHKSVSPRSFDRVVNGSVNSVDDEQGFAELIQRIHEREDDSPREHSNADEDRRRTQIQEVITALYACPTSSKYDDMCDECRGDVYIVRVCEACIWHACVPYTALACTQGQCAMNVVETFTSSGCVKHASGMRVCRIQHMHVHRSSLQRGTCLASV